MSAMPLIIFYEKPGCINNTKQKKILKAAGYSLIERDILTESWTPESLRKFFGNLPVDQWFNQSAPAVKNEEIAITELNEIEALALMVSDPILIRRPLMRLGDTHKVGFDIDILDELIGLSDQYKYMDIETCPRSIH